MSDSKLDLVISRVLKAPRQRLFEAWTNPDQLKQWWCPKPWWTEIHDFDPRPGGAFKVSMHGPDGGLSGVDGCFLDVSMERIAFTTALLKEWRPATEPWLVITGVFTMADEGEGTRYVARCMHRNDADKNRHEELGFFDGWGTCISQLEAVARG